jgi:hypothetical protein
MARACVVGDDVACGGSSEAVWGVIGGGDVACALVVGCDVACGRCRWR